MQWKWKACYVICQQVALRNIVWGQTHVADSPRNGTLFTCGGRLVGLALDTEVHDVVTANGAVVDDDVPAPKGYRVPLQIVTTVLKQLMQP